MSRLHVLRDVLLLALAAHFARGHPVRGVAIATLAAIVVVLLVLVGLFRWLWHHWCVLASAAT